MNKFVFCLSIAAFTIAGCDWPVLRDVTEPRAPGTDVDESKQKCKEGFVLVDEECVCPGGFEGSRCDIDINECGSNNGDCGDVNYVDCINNEGAPPTCVDINECEVRNGGCGDQLFFNCINNEGTEPSCEDIDECALETDNCAEDATCENIDGGFTCTCFPGYSGNGKLCVDINECVYLQDACSENTKCRNLEGSHECDCLSGFASATGETVNVGAGTLCNSVCGDSLIKGDEVCDDGNANSEFECPYGVPACTLCNADCTSTLELTGTYCGDETNDVEEACDDGNLITETACPYGIQFCTGCSADCSTPLSLTGSYCGDGTKDPLEFCDDGNSISEVECDYGVKSCISCKGDCSGEVAITGKFCGDGTVDAEEACDDQNNQDETDCNYGTPTCTGCKDDCSEVLSLVGPHCGDGEDDPEELCDDGNNFDEVECPYGQAACITCSADCAEETPQTGSYCGDAVNDEEEVCDDGNTIDETECEYGTPTCAPCNADCTAELPLIGSHCGDGVDDPPELCDDGNNITEVECAYGLGTCVTCNTDCTAEIPLSGSYCGDGTLDAEEVCDDGNTIEETACPYGVETCSPCNADCSAELNLIGPFCGDGNDDLEELCDDGNKISEAECTYGTPSCTYCNSTCSAEIPLTGSYCGDGTNNTEETCDDGNIISETACSYGIPSCTFCNLDCSSELSLNGSYCGDGVDDIEEVCDDGNTVTETSCAYGTPTCTNCSSTCNGVLVLFGSVCGDGITDVADGEECDTGVANSDSIPGGCRTNCKLARCGNGVIDAGEECDDSGESVACNNDCSNASCGDGVLNITASEECDDGDDSNSNGCVNCLNAICGDGFIFSEGFGNETCDGDCPDTCDDSNSCTVDTMSGNSATCSTSCSHSEINTCNSGDGCCGPGCNSLNDNDCAPIACASTEVQNSSHEATDAIIGSTGDVTSVVCNAGYTGGGNWTCGVDQLFSGALCDPAFCPAQSVFSFGNCFCKPGSSGTIIWNDLNNTFSGVCSVCSAGDYQPSHGQPSCNNCGSGNVTDTLLSGGARSCAACETGNYDHDLLSTTACIVHSVTDCDPGETLTAGTPSSDGLCVRCGTSTYDHDSSATTTCIPHTVVDCNVGEELTQGSTTSDGSCEACTAGTYDDDAISSTACVNCGSGSFTTNATSCTPCEAGTWDDDSSSATACVNQVCPLNAAGSPSCECDSTSGYAGALNWNSPNWEGICRLNSGYGCSLSAECESQNCSNNVCAPGFVLSEVSGSSSLTTQGMGLIDFNGDSAPDLLITANDGTNIMYQINGDVTQCVTGSNNSCDFVDALGGNSTVVVVGNLDGDPSPEFLIGGQGAPIEAWNYNGIKWAKTTFGGSNIRDLVLEDFDGDSDLDCLEVDGTDGSRVWVNNGNGTFSTGHLISNHDLHKAVVGYFNSDSHLDVIAIGSSAASNNIRVFLGNGGWAFSESTQSPLSTNGNGFPRSIAVGDFDNDTDMDFFVGMQGSTNEFRDNAIFTNSGSANFSEESSMWGTRNTYAIAIEDIDNDGDIDFVFGNRNKSNSTDAEDALWLNNYSSTWEDNSLTETFLMAPTSYVPGSNDFAEASSIVVGKLDGPSDTKVDIITGNLAGGPICVWKQR